MDRFYEASGLEVIEPDTSLELMRSTFIWDGMPEELLRIVNLAEAALLEESSHDRRYRDDPQGSDPQTSSSTRWRMVDHRLGLDGKGDHLQGFLQRTSAPRSPCTSIGTLRGGERRWTRSHYDSNCCLRFLATTAT